MIDKDFEARCEKTLHVPKIDPIVEAVIAKVEKTDFPTILSSVSILTIIKPIQLSAIDNVLFIANSLGFDAGQEKAYVIEQLRKRSEIGIKKYGKTLFESKQSEREFKLHLFEELLDAMNYAEKLLTILNTLSNDRHTKDAN